MKYGLESSILGIAEINGVVILAALMVVVMLLAISHCLMYRTGQPESMMVTEFYLLRDEKIKFLNHEFKSILSNTVNGIIVVDNNRDILIFNKSAIRMLDCDNQLNDNPVVTKYLSSLEGRCLDDIIEMLNAHDAMRDILRKDMTGFFDIDVIDGEQKFYTIYVNPLTSTSKSMIGVIYTIDDITEVKKSEIMRRDFVANVSHELKTPLTSIRGFIETLRDGAIDNPEVSGRFLSIIDIEATRLKSLIEDILALSEIESDTNKEVINFNITPIMNELHIMMKEIAGVYGVKLKFHGLSNNPSSLSYVDERYIVTGNPNWFKQLIINLVDNAIKYSSYVEKPYVDVFFYRVDENLIIRVEDNGIGIPMESIERLYEKFYRVDKVRGRKKIAGTGLGLSIVKHIVDSMNGIILVDSVLDAGTAFTIEIPLAETVKPVKAVNRFLF